MVKPLLSVGSKCMPYLDPREVREARQARKRLRELGKAAAAKSKEAAK
jgi:hypothetical protein